MSNTTGLHHITAMAGHARRNVQFYAETLGLRLVKKTVNFDDPGTYHLYYGDEVGSPGTIMTFFPWENAAPGRRGAGEASETAFAIPAGSLSFWQERLAKLGVPSEPMITLFGEKVLPFADPDGMSHHLVEVAGVEHLQGYAQHGVPTQHAIRGFAGITLWSARPQITGAVLEILGYAEQGQEGGVTRWVSTGADIGTRIDVRDATGLGRGMMGTGTVHHIAFRAADDAAQAEMAKRLSTAGLFVTEQKDRNYFRSVYFREPGGVLFEIATDDPGFAIDEPQASLGETLKLPIWLEPRRSDIEAVLPNIAA